MLTASGGDVGLNSWHDQGLKEETRKRLCSDGVSSPGSVSITSDP